MKKICGTSDIAEYPTITPIATAAYIIPVENLWPEPGGNVINKIKINQRSTLKSDSLNALNMVSLNGPKCGTSKHHI